MTTHAELFEVGLAEALAVNPRFSEEVARADGTVLNTALNAGAAMAHEIGFRLSERLADLFADTASGEALSRLAHDRYGIQRQGATASLGSVQITRVATVASVTVPRGTVLRTADGIRVETLAPLTFGIGTAGPSSVGVVSLQAGVDQNADADTVVAFEGAPTQADMTVTNPERLAGGNAVETDEALRARIRGFWVNARRAVLGAIVEGALSVAQVREAAAYEQLDPAGNPAGAVTVVVSDESGDSNGTLEAAVESELVEWRAAGVSCVVVGGTRVEVDIAVTVTWRAGQATPANALNVKQAIASRVNALDANGAATAAEAPAESWLTPGLIEQAARNVDGVLNVVVTTPAGTEKPAHGEIFRTDVGRITVT